MLRSGTKVKMNNRLKERLELSGNVDHLNEFGNCIGIVVGLTDFGNCVGPEVDVRWQPSNLRYAYHPRNLEVVEE